MSTYIFTSTLREFLTPRRLIVWLFAIAAVVGLGYAWLFFAKTHGTDGGYARLVGIMGFRLVALVSAVFSTAVIAGEVEQKTIVYLLTRPIPRPVLIIARALASVVTVGIIATVMVLAIGIMNFGPSALGKEMVYRDVMVVWMGAAAYGSLFLFISLILNRAFMFCLLFAFGWESFVPQMPGDLYYASVHSHMRALTLHPEGTQPTQALANLTSGGIDAIGSVPTATAIAVLIGFFVVGMALSATWFNKFEYTPREDAE